MSFAYMPVYTGDYLRDTRHLTPQKHGVYLLLLMFCWDQKGPVPLDEQEAAGIANCRSADEIESLRYILARFFVRMDDGFYNKRMQLEVERSEALSRARADAGRKGYESKRQSELREAQAIAKQLPSNCQASASIPNPNPIPTPDQEKHMARQSAPPRPRKADAKTPVPADFQVSERVRRWAEAKGWAKDLDAYLEAFKLAAEKGRLTYASHDAALMTSIRDDWGKVRQGGDGRGKVIDAWHMSEAGIIRKAAEVGVRAKPGETLASLRDRINATIQTARAAA